MTYTISETAELFGVSAHTLRYYDKEGLLPFVGRTASGLRAFTDNDFEWLKIILCLKNTGMQIKDIKHFIDLCVDGESTYEKRLEFIRLQKECIEKQMTALRKNYDTIIHKEEFYIKAIAERKVKT